VTATIDKRWFMKLSSRVPYMKSPKFLIVISIFIFALSILGIIRSSNNYSGRTEVIVKRMGDALAMELMQGLEKGDEILVLTVPTGLAKGVQAQKDTLLKRLEKNGIKIKAIRMLERPDALNEWHYHEDAGFSVQEYLDAVAAYPVVDAVLSLAGHLRLNLQDLQKLPENTPPLLLAAVSKPQLYFEELCQRKLIKVAILPRPDDQRNFSGRPASAEQWLKEYFDVIVVE